MSSGSFKGIPERLTAGDEAAAAELWSRFTNRLIALARTRLDATVQQRVGPDDVVQSVYKSFFRRQQQGQFELDNWDGVWALLARITVRKCGRSAAAHRVAKRDVRRQARQGANESDDDLLNNLSEREPSPEEVAVFEDLLEALMLKLESDKRDMLALRLQGYTVEEVSQKVDRTERAVYRLMARVRNILREMEIQTDEIKH